MSLLDYTAVELAAKIKAGETTATEAMEAVIAQIEKSEDELNKAKRKRTSVPLLHL
jgi:aspartyl-tRNA(Asn)/glutamyl-tRNA(Gln) amidotransferase subunit A